MESQENSLSELQNIIFEFGNVMYRLGRMETDGLDSSEKEYTKMSKRKEELFNIISKFFKK
jgi:predicted nucleotide-binding protein